MSEFTGGYAFSASKPAQKSEPRRENRLALRALTAAFNDRRNGSKACRVAEKTADAAQLRAPVLAASNDSTSSASNPAPKTEPRGENRMALRALMNNFNDRRNGSKACRVVAETAAPTQSRAPVLAASVLDTNKKRPGPEGKAKENSAARTSLRAAVSLINSRRAVDSRFGAGNE